MPQNFEMQLTKLEIKTLLIVQMTSLETVKLLMSFLLKCLPKKIIMYMSWMYLGRSMTLAMLHILTSIEGERMLSKIKLSVSGCDDIRAHDNFDKATLSNL